MCTAGINPNSHAVISVSARLIFTEFTGLETFERVSLSIHSFCNHSRDIAMATNFMAKFVKFANPKMD